MSNHYSLSTRRWLFRGALIVIVGLLVLSRIGYSHNQSTAPSTAILQGSIQLASTQPISSDDITKIQPGTGLKVAVTVENKGQKPSAEGELYVRYAFAKPLDEEETSIIFETEKKSLPSINPGESMTIHFDASHQTPSILDFVREDWSIREYQAIAIIDHKENVLGTLALTFSAHYYPGIRKEFPTPLSTNMN